MAEAGLGDFLGNRPLLPRNQTKRIDGEVVGVLVFAYSRIPIG
jgi:hypothetical protein